MMNRQHKTRLEWASQLNAVGTDPSQVNKYLRKVRPTDHVERV